VSKPYVVQHVFSWLAHISSRLLFILYYIIMHTYTHAPTNNLIHALLKCYFAHILTRRAKTTYAAQLIWVQIFKNKKFSQAVKIAHARINIYQFDRTVALQSRWKKLQLGIPILCWVYLYGLYLYKRIYVLLNWNRRVRVGY